MASLILLEEDFVLLELGPRGNNLWNMKIWMDLGTGRRGLFKKKVVDLSQKEISSC